jgi:hypothetical protein
VGFNCFDPICDSVVVFLIAVICTMYNVRLWRLGREVFVIWEAGESSTTRVDRGSLSPK